MPSRPRDRPPDDDSCDHHRGNAKTCNERHAALWQRDDALAAAIRALVVTPGQRGRALKRHTTPSALVRNHRRTAILERRTPLWLRDGAHAAAARTLVLLPGHRRRTLKTHTTPWALAPNHRLPLSLAENEPPTILSRVRPRRSTSTGKERTNRPRGRSGVDCRTLRETSDPRDASATVLS